MNRDKCLGNQISVRVRKDSGVGRRWPWVREMVTYMGVDQKQLHEGSWEPDFSLLKEGFINKKREKTRVNLMMLDWN